MIVSKWGYKSSSYNNQSVDYAGLFIRGGKIKHLPYFIFHKLCSRCLIQSFCKAPKSSKRKRKDVSSRNVKWSKFVSKLVEIINFCKDTKKLAREQQYKICVDPCNRMVGNGVNLFVPMSGTFSESKRRYLPD